MIKVDGHIIHEELVSDGGWSLDVGCRGFQIAEHFPNQTFICLDPDKNIEYPDLDNVIYLRSGIGVKSGKKYYCNWSFGTGNYTIAAPKDAPHYAEDTYQIDIIGLEDLMSMYKVSMFDILKIDIEGDEYELLSSINKPVAKQITVEFHDFLGRCPYPGYYSDLLAGDFGKYYEVSGEYQYDHIPGCWERNYRLKS